MKSLKLVIINALTLLVGLGLMTSSVSQRRAEAARVETVPALQIKQLGNYRGQYLHVLYVVGSRPFIATESSQINVSQVKEARTVYISSDSMPLTSVQVEKEGFRPSYNMILLVVSSSPEYSWVNADGSTPQGSSGSSNHTSTLINAINKADVEDFLATSGEGAILGVDLKK